jgi:hypothetical protein
MRTILFTFLFYLLALACTVSMAATVYKWVDEEGVVHYSDQPHENAQKVELKAPQTYSAPKTSAPAQSSRSTPARKSSAYQSCTVSEPANEQAFLNTDTVTAGVTVQPAVRPGDTAVVTLDGSPVPGVPPTGGQFTISPVDRGTHTIQMVVKDPDGTTVCSSAPVTFYVRQPSLQSPTNPSNPVKRH